MMPPRRPPLLRRAGARPAALLGAFVLAMTPGTASAADKALFLKNCAPCHGTDGKARSPAARKLGVKDLSISRLDDAAIRRQILDGLQDKGGRPKMPSFRDKFTDAELADLIEIVKTFRE